MKQRIKQPGVTREKILAAAGGEFARHGYAGSGVAAMVTAAGLTKGALFHHFPDKAALAKAWLEECLAPMIRERWLEPLALVESLAELKRLCRERMELMGGDDPTLLLAAMAVELGREGGDLADGVAAVFDALRAAVAGVFERGRQAGWIYPSVKPAAEAAMWVALVTGGVLQANVGPGVAVGQAWLGAMEDYLDTLRTP